MQRLTKPLYLDYPIARSYISTGIGSCLMSYLGFLFYLIAPIVFAVMTDGFWLRSVTVPVQPNLLFVGPSGLKLETDDPFQSFFWSSESALGVSNFIPTLSYPRPTFRDPNLKLLPASPTAYFTVDLPPYALENGTAACHKITAADFFITGCVALNHPTTGRIAHSAAVVSSHVEFGSAAAGASVHFQGNVRTHSLIKPSRENDFFRNPPPALSTAEQESAAAAAVRAIVATLPRGGASPVGVTDPAGAFSAGRQPMRSPLWGASLTEESTGGVVEGGAGGASGADAPGDAGAGGAPGADGARRQGDDVAGAGGDAGTAAGGGDGSAVDPMGGAGGAMVGDPATPGAGEAVVPVASPTPRFLSAYPGSYGGEMDVSGGSDALVQPTSYTAASAVLASAAGGPASVGWTPQATPPLGRFGALYESLSKAMRAPFSLDATPTLTSVTRAVRPGAAYRGTLPWQASASGTSAGGGEGGEAAPVSEGAAGRPTAGEVVQNELHEDVSFTHVCPPFELMVTVEMTMERVGVAPTVWAVLKFAWMQYFPLVVVAYAGVTLLKRLFLKLNLVRVHLQQPPPALYTPPHPR